MLVFSRLGEEWRNDKPPLAYVSDFINQVRSMFSALSEAGVAHMDARPANIMWKATSESTVQLSLIDFEAVYSFGELADDCKALIKKANDLRYPFSESTSVDVVVVCEKFNEFFFQAVCGWVSSELESFAKFMEKRHGTICQLCGI